MVSPEQTQQEIITPDYEIQEQIEELNADIKWSTGLAVGAVAVAGAIGLDLYSRTTGNYTPVSEVTSQATGEIGPPWLLDPIGMAGALAGGVKAGRNSISLRSQRRSLKNLERTKKKTAIEHYRANQELYQTLALEDERARN